jgi:hypothetical protein
VANTKHQLAQPLRQTPIDQCDNSMETSKQVLPGSRQPAPDIMADKIAKHSKQPPEKGPTLPREIHTRRKHIHMLHLRNPSKHLLL